jgi:hypothetical protein
MGRPLRILLASVLAAVMSACTSGCPDALLEGVLAEQAGTLAVQHEDGFIAPVRWSASHHRVEERDGELAVVDWIGFVTAREGDMVRLGGGERDGLWQICGMFEAVPPDT